MSTTFEFNLPYIISLNLTVQCNCSNKLQTPANLTSFIALQIAYTYRCNRENALSRLNSIPKHILTLNKSNINSCRRIFYV